MSTDSRLQQAVLDELKWEPSVTAAHIGVAAKAGVVTLSGHVENFAQKHAAEKAARRVKGVQAVAEELDVRLAFDNQRDDADIAAAVIDRLAWDSSVPRNAIEIKVENGWVTLTGQVAWHFEKEAAERDVRPLLGVIGISNNVTLKPPVDTSNITEDIQHALHRSWFFDPATVDVTAVGGAVRLTGSVHTLHERLVAGQTAWASPGTTSVENNLHIN